MPVKLTQVDPITFGMPLIAQRFRYTIILLDNIMAKGKLPLWAFF